MSSLQEAKDALYSGDKNTAQAIIADVLKVDQNNAEAWFLLSEAVDGDRKAIFLNKALKLNPNIEEEMKREAAESTAVDEPDFILDTDDEVDDEGFDIITPADFDSFGQFEDEEFDEPEDSWDEELEEETEDYTDGEEERFTEPMPSKSVSTASTMAKPQTVRKEDPQESSNLLNTVGLAISLLLSVILFILFVQALLSLF